MVHRLLILSLGFLTLATCQNPKNSEKQEIPDTAEKTEVVTNTTVSSTKPEVSKPKKTTEPEMSTGLPPDKEAVETAKKEQQAAVTNKSGVIYLKEGENKFVKEYEMNVTFKQLSEDSRCPKDVNCIWAGVATADVEFMGLSTRPVTLKLSTMNDAKKGYSKTQEFNGYSVSLVEVSPETTSAKGFKALKGSYRIGLKITKGSLGDPTTQRGGTTTK
ncbi:hypothetical protein KSK37_06780 [Kaistella sp. DKR-2]|uniref:hypothetical protein n=1 Tax=Kaistella soli TaxID=2849654 RepID=UPI001C26872E|nr:hypothetical protein [Kaistella soli]MBU8882783.1 hypothetical protein [Kaistella soli]